MSKVYPNAIGEDNSALKGEMTLKENRDINDDLQNKKSSKNSINKDNHINDNHINDKQAMNRNENDHVYEKSPLKIQESQRVKTDNFQEGIEFRWENINITKKNTGCCGKVKSTITILNQVSGVISSGESLAILGASGAGKTTLLNHLSRKIISSSFETSGEITVNSQKMTDKDFQAISSYVMQDDVLEATMTAKEILMFTAKMRMNGSTEQIQQVIQKIAKTLKIEKCMDTKIGDNLNRGVSGGERKRVSIGVELLANSPILFLDEPTTGLDSYNAYELIKNLNKLSKEEKKIIIYTIHQPASEIYEILDKICVLALGKTVFFGNKFNLNNYFVSIKLPLPTKYNPFDHIIDVTTFSAIENTNILEQYSDLISIEDRQERYKSYVDKLNQIYKDSFEEKVAIKYDCISKNLEQEIYQSQNRFGFFYQLFMLFLREIILTIRRTNVLKIKVGQNVIISLIISLLFNEIQADFIGIRDRLGFMFILSVLLTMNSVISNITICKLLYILMISVIR